MQSQLNPQPSPPASIESALIFAVDCPVLDLHRKYLERRGFRLTTVLSPECRVLLFCPDHLGLYEVGVSKLDTPRLVVGGMPPTHWPHAQGLTAPVLPAVLERAIVHILAPAAPAEVSRYRILLVDDDATVRHAATSAFEDAGFEVHSVDGFARVQEEMKRHPDFILIDLNLPGLSGEKLGEILRRQQVPMGVFSSEPAARLEAARERIGAVAAYSKGMPLHMIAHDVRRHIAEAKRH